MHSAKNAYGEGLVHRMAYDLVRLSQATNTPHLASSLSSVHLMAYLYWREMKLQGERDRFILSKGHAAAVHYTVLYHRGYISEDELFSLGANNSRLEEHSGVKAPPEVDTVSGSLGHGLSVGTGMAYAAKLNRSGKRCFVLMGDGEQNEGQVWEAAQHATVLGLDNLFAIIDCNKWQGTGRSQDITNLEPLDERWRSFGWAVERVDGHDLSGIEAAFDSLKNAHGQPKAIVADTVKGWGVSFMADDNNWHYRIPNEKEVSQAAEELGIE